MAVIGLQESSPLSRLWSVDEADAVSWLEGLAPRSVDLMITDPAYESLEKHRSKGTTTRLTKRWFPIFRNGRFPDFFRAAHLALKANAHLYLMCDHETMRVIVPDAEQAGFRFWKPLIWDKQKLGMGYHYRCRHELVLFFEKGRRRLNDLSVPDVLSVASIRHKGAYPTEKPVDLLRVLVRQSSAEGELVVDPFAGSGATGEAALGLGRAFAGCDVVRDAVERAQSRLQSVESGGAR